MTCLKIRVQSITNGEKFDVYGSAAPNTLAIKLVTGSAVDNAFLSIPLDGGHYDSFYFVTVTPQGSSGTHELDNALLDTISADVPPAVSPEPATLAMLVLGGLAMLSRRK